MAFTLGSLFQAIVFVLNALTILHDERFLSPNGWGSKCTDARGAKGQIVGLLNSMRFLMPVPLILFNALIIVYELLLG